MRGCGSSAGATNVADRHFAQFVSGPQSAWGIARKRSTTLATTRRQERVQDNTPPSRRYRMSLSYRFKDGVGRILEKPGIAVACVTALFAMGFSCGNGATPSRRIQTVVPPLDDYKT